MNAITERPFVAERFTRLLAEIGSEGVLFFYSGFLSQNVAAAVGETLRCKLEAAGASGATARKVFSSFIEMAQNVVHYAVPAGEPVGAAGGGVRYGAIAVVQAAGGHFALMCSNAIPAAGVERLRGRLEHLRGMSRDEIRAAYREQLRGEPDEGSKGAGLGLLTLARDAVEPIEFHFAPSPACPEHALFYLQTVI